MENFRLNPDNAVIRDQEKRLIALDIAARTYPGLGRHDGIVKYAEELLVFVADGLPSDKPARTAPKTLADLLALVPKQYLRTAKELKAAGVERAAAAAPLSVSVSDRHDDDDQVGDGRNTSHDVGTVIDGAGGAGPASLRQAGGGN